MNWLNDVHFVEVATQATVSTNDTLTSPMGPTGLNVADTWLDSEPVILRRSDAGVSVPVTETVAIVGTDLVITEGSTGFDDDDISLIMLVNGSISRDVSVAYTACCEDCDVLWVVLRFGGGQPQHP